MKPKNYNFKYQCYLAIAFYTGMRSGEILSLKRSEIDFDKKTISINSTMTRKGEGTPKTHSGVRVIPLFDSLVPYLKKILASHDGDYVLMTQLGKPYRDNTTIWARCWIPLLFSLGFDYRVPYTTRHTFATNMLYNGHCKPVELSQMLGHSNTKMIERVYVVYLKDYLLDFDRSISVYK